jgi:hypothetical protein
MAEEGRAIRLFDVTRSLAYERNVRFLSAVPFTEGMYDLAANVPDRDRRLLAPTASLYATPDLHPAIVPLLIEAAREIHGRGDLFEETDEFPSPRQMEAPLAVAADQYFRSGPSFLYRVLPFGLAAAVDRLKIMLLPLLTLLLPLLKVAPPLYRWRIRSKIYRWYRVLRDVEARLKASDEEADVSGLLEELAVVEHEIDAVKVPPSYMEELYNLKMHLALIRQQAARTPPAA